MALKDYSTAQAADILVRISPLLENITTDEDIMGTIGKSMNTEGMTRVGRIVESMRRTFTSIPLILGTHQDDIFGIIALVKGKTLEEVREQPITATMADIKDVATDEDLRDFFSAFGRMEKGA